MSTEKIRVVITVRQTEILRSVVDYTKLFAAIVNANEIISVASLFLRSYLLYVLEHNIDNPKKQMEEPKISVDFIGAVFSVLMTPEDGEKKGRPFDPDKNIQFAQRQKYHTVVKSTVPLEGFDTG